MDKERDWTAKQILSRELLFLTLLLLFGGYLVLYLGHYCVVEWKIPLPLLLLFIVVLFVLWGLIMRFVAFKSIRYIIVVIFDTVIVLSFVADILLLYFIHLEA